MGLIGPQPGFEGEIPAGRREQQVKPPCPAAFPSGKQIEVTLSVLFLPFINEFCYSLRHLLILLPSSPNIDKPN